MSSRPDDLAIKYQSEVNIQNAPLNSSLHQTFAWTLGGNITYAVCQWGILVVLAKVGTPEMVGQFALGLAIAAPILMLANLQLRPLQATDTQSMFEFSDYLGLRLITAVLAFCMICFSVLMCGLSPSTASVVLVVGIAKCIESVSDALYGQLQKADRMDRIAMSMMMKGPLSLAAMAVVVWSTGRVVWGATALAAVWSFLGATFDWTSATHSLRQTHVRPIEVVKDLRNADRHATATRFSLRWRPSILVELVRLALPMGVAMMLLVLATNIPKYLVERDLGEGALGYFSALAYPGYGMSLLVAALGQSASARLARAYVSGGKAFGRLLLMLATITLLVGVIAVGVVIVMGRDILSMLYRPEYAQYSGVFAILTVSTVIWSLESILGYGATASRAYLGQAWAGGIAAGVSMISGIVLVRSYGLLGAAWATVIGGIAALVAFLIVVLKATRRRAYLCL